MKKRDLKPAAPRRGQTGRPTLYKFAHNDMLIEYMSQGKSWYTFGAQLNLSRATIEHWLKTQPTFRDAYEIGHAKYTEFWENAGNNGTLGQIKGFNGYAWSFNMKNRFRWADRVSVEGEVPLQLNKVLQLEEPKETSLELLDMSEVRGGESSEEVPTDS